MNVYSGLFSHSRGYFSMRKHFLSLFIISLFVIFVFSACDANLRQEPTGKATISIENKIEDSSNSSGGTNQSTTTLFIKEYKITGTGPNGAKIDETVDAEESVVSYDSIATGNWSLKIEAINYSDAIVGEGKASINIEEGNENKITINVIEQEGKGKLLVNIKYQGEYNTTRNLTFTVASKGNTSVTKTENLIRSVKDKNAYYSTTMDLESGFYTISVIDTDKNTQIYSQDIRIVDGTMTYVDARANESIVAITTVGKLPEVEFDANYFVAQNCPSYMIYFKFLNINADNIVYRYKYEDMDINYTSSPYCDISLSQLNATVGKHKVTVYLCIGEILNNKVICSADFYFEVTEAVTSDNLNSLIANALPDVYLAGNRSYDAIQQSTNLRFSIKDAKATLHDNTPVVFNTNGEELSYSSNLISTLKSRDFIAFNDLEITHNNSTIKYQVQGYLEFIATFSSDGLHASEITGSGIKKDGEDISSNQAELEKLVSYLCAFMTYCENPESITYTYISNQNIDTYIFENYRSGDYSIDGNVNFNKMSNNIEENPYQVQTNSDLTFKNGNDNSNLHFDISYTATGTKDAQNPNLTIFTYSDLLISNIHLNGVKLEQEDLSEEALAKIKRFVLCYDK